ncbi:MULTISPECIES: hypothetical protein [unclassified Nostoc]|uniref:hypothetical protein n=1 Tax=unclassified Nostoc TaxID=2593658 RepID=UPI0018C65042|nr:MULTISPECIES: hypothetical protein [unclassified Nostoc]MBG1240567.1 hypothetical protein [Nostoc sp. NZL]MBN3961741.1 hypothetical protein [Nostoc sp. NMS8]
MTFSVFGTKPSDSICLPEIPYSARLNCKLGGIFVGGQEDIHRRTSSNETVDIAIIKVSKYFGSLGLEYVGQWMQIFFIPAPNVSPKVLPTNTVCVAYIKKQNISNLFAKVQEVIGEEDPGTGIFTIGFEKQAGKDNSTYYTINFGWRKREGEEENKQLQQIAGFLQSNPTLIDLEGTRTMQCLDGLSTTEVAAIVGGVEELEQLPSTPSKKQLKGTKG